MIFRLPFEFLWLSKTQMQPEEGLLEGLAKGAHFWASLVLSALSGVCWGGWNVFVGGPLLLRLRFSVCIWAFPRAAYPLSFFLGRECASPWARPGLIAFIL